MNKNNRIYDLFGRATHKLLSVYMIAGYPAPDDTVSVLCALEQAGVDLVEVGFPFSDSLVDGPTIQAANEQALAGGMTLERYFQQVTRAREIVTLPLIAMTCWNPVLQFGVDRFVQRCIEAGIDGVILPDLPIDIFELKYRSMFQAAGLCPIFLVTSHTESERLQKIDSLSEGFIYVVSSDATTGGVFAIDDERERFFESLASAKLKNPLMVGFGIVDHMSFKAAVKHATGGIVGSAFIRALSGPGNLVENIKAFVGGLRGEDQ